MNKTKLALIGSSVAMLLMVIIWANLLRKSEAITLLKQDAQIIQITTRQLPHDSRSNTVPVEIQTPLALSKNKNEVEQFSCVIKNNTNKDITAITLAITTVLDEEGKEAFDTYFLTTDSLVHSDIKEERGLRATEPTSSQLLQLPGPISFKEIAIVKNIIVEIRCTLFADDTSLGYDPNGEFATRIRLIREGASRYKQWLITQSSQLKTSISGILKKSGSRELPEDEFPNKSLREGADVYRRWLLRVHDSKGLEAAEAYLKKSVLKDPR